MWTYARPRPSRSEAARLGLLAALTAAALVLALLAALGAPRAQAATRAAARELPRCYWVRPPVTLDTPLLLNSGLVNCTFNQCRAALPETSQSGWVCFFQRPW